LRRCLAAFTLAAFLMISVSARPQTIPDRFVDRVEALALLQTLNATLLSHPSATLTLEQWCGTHHLAADNRIHADRVHGQDKAPDAAVRHDLGVGPDEPVRYRRVRLSCGEHVLSEADNWYVPARLTPEMNRVLDETDTPFGRAVLSLGFTRRTLQAELLWQPLEPGWEMRPPPADGTGHLAVPAAILQHRGLLTTADGKPFCEVVETYQRAMFAFAWPGG
jgi:chorismate-pyruvate lyase